MRRTLHIFISVMVMILLLWLAVRQVDLQELAGLLASVQTGWILPFALVLTLSHYLRAERWRLLIPGKTPPRSTLFAGVMLGYMANYILPRLGEISRPVYVARQQEASSGELFGTIVLERMVDLVSLAAILFIILFFHLGDDPVIRRLMGSEHWSIVLVTLLLSLPVAVALFWLLVRWFRSLEKRQMVRHPLLLWGIRFFSHVWDGVKAVRRVQNWPMFLIHSAGIWIGYILMSWLPFLMLDLPARYGLGLTEAMVITVIAAVGVIIPTPGGAGSYHLLVQQGLWLLYSVPVSVGLTYATVTHAVTLLVVVAVGAATLWYDKKHTLNGERIR